MNATSRFCGRVIAGVIIGLVALVGSVSWAEDSPPKAHINWVLKLPGTKKTSLSSPALAPDGTIYQATFDGTLFAITPRGTIQWHYDLPNGSEIKSSPAVAQDGTIYFGARDRHFYAITSAGKLKWSLATGGWVDSSPAIASDGSVYFGSWDKQFYAVTPTGATKWVLNIGAVIVSSPALGADGTVYFGAMDKKVYAVNPEGRVKWTFLTGGEIVASPAIGRDGLVYIPSIDGNLYALRPDGSEKWHYHSGGFQEASPVIDENGNVAITAFYSLHFIRPEGLGHTISGMACLVDSASIALSGQIASSRPWRTLQGFHGDGGPVLWQADTAFNLSASPVMSPEGIIYAVAERELYAIRPPSPIRHVANSPWPMFHADAQHTGRVAAIH